MSEAAAQPEFVPPVAPLDGPTASGRWTRETCAALDAADPHASRRAAFDLEEGLVYLDGNSLGPLSAGARARLHEAVEREWRRDLIRSWNTAGWFELPERVGARLARLLGARPGEVLVDDSTSANLFKLALAAIQARGGRGRIVSEAGNFPTDLYVLQGLARLCPGVEFVAVPREAIPAAIRAGAALVVLTHVHYKSGEMYDLPGITRLAHEAGAAVLWDLSHSVGAVPVDLRAAGADLAVGCGYKYLNGGPGAPAFLYVREDLQASLSSPLCGWMGHAEPFAFDDAYAPAPGLRRFRCGTPPVLALSALDGALEAFEGVDLAALRAKAIGLATLFRELVARECAHHGPVLASPADPARCGNHVGYAHPRGYEIVQALIDRGVIGDFRAPDLMRFGFAPLYVRYVDVWDAVARLREVLETRAYERPEYARRAAVT
ncbi:MAG: kynureninase [Steroidobacteraceae bacterium]|jgi:kynureninase|nr:kynureninase [Steroidobacteraceae bacterium]